MCHDPASRPPAPPRVGAVAETGRLTLTSADGAEFSAAFALPVEPPRAAIMVLPDVRGLHGYYLAFVERLAEAGYAAIAVDYFGRTAGLVGDLGREGDFDFGPHLAETSPESIDADTTAALDAIRSRTSASLPALTLGFCFGGSNAWRQSAGTLDLVGTMGLYGRPSMVGDAADHASKPVLMMIAGDDKATSVPDQHALAGRMRAAGAEVVDVVFPGAPHSFFDRDTDQWLDACNEAWNQLIEFTDRLSARP